MRRFLRFPARFFDVDFRAWITVVIIIALFWLLVTAYHWIAPKFAPPRPVFSDEFATYRVLGMYQWNRPSPLIDEFENWAYSDKYLNVVLLMGGDSDLRRYRTFPAQSGVESVVFLPKVHMRFRVEPNTCYMFAEGTTLITCKLKPDAAIRIRDEEARLFRERDWPTFSLPDFIEPLLIVDSEDKQNIMHALELMRIQGPTDLTGPPYGY